VPGAVDVGFVIVPAKKKALYLLDIEERTNFYG